MKSRRIWDIFCTVIDNHGDLGVSWRLARQLAQAGQSVRLWVDDASALAWMAPTAVRAKWPQIQVLPWADASNDSLLEKLPPADVWIEAFGCTLPEAFVAHAVGKRPLPPAWINLEYLSAEAWVPRMHHLPSPVMSGPAKGWTKYFYYPGFTTDTGGLLREPDLLARQTAFSQNERRNTWRQQATDPLTQHNSAHVAPDGLLISLFCYETSALPQLLAQCAGAPHTLLVTPGRPLAAVQQALAGLTVPPCWSALPYTDQDGFDEMLWACDLNFVRGEDSLVRALWAGKPFIWHIYPQDDNAHHDKLEAFLDWLEAPESLRQAHRVWNGLIKAPLPGLGPARLNDSANSQNWADWIVCAQSARQRLLTQPDLTSQLMAMVDTLTERAAP